MIDFQPLRLALTYSHIPVFPQGTYLGPLLFLICINYIYISSQKISFFLFADETDLLYGDKSLRSLELNYYLYSFIYYCCFFFFACSFIPVVICNTLLAYWTVSHCSCIRMLPESFPLSSQTCCWRIYFNVCFPAASISFAILLVGIVRYVF